MTTRDALALHLAARGRRRYGIFGAADGMLRHLSEHSKQAHPTGLCGARVREYVRIEDCTPCPECAAELRRRVAESAGGVA